ncbi:MAG TPA: alpha-L-fucosidase, partial [Opitutaceae bacterium]|nr:alpha-L-fucosidase [Opitutaceae bacterium]
MKSLFLITLALGSLAMGAEPDFQPHFVSPGAPTAMEALALKLASHPRIAPGPFQPTWDSLAKQYRCPEWFRDAKFGIWAHWSAQCEPEHGDWYARDMYLQGSKDYESHLKEYGHPSQAGFMEIDHLWKADKWDPEKLMTLYQRAGAKYFVALANHHDNFDTYDSKYQPWNSINVGPKKDIVGTWAKVAREHGLRFGVSNHSSHAWHWFQVAYGHDVEGPQAGVPYDAARLTKADGKGKWWEGLDPKDLYGGLRIPMPDTIKTVKEAAEWHRRVDGHWYESIPPYDNGYAEKWFLRAQDLVDKYHPDLLYFDDTELPLDQFGLAIAAHYYNANEAYHHGRLEAVINAKHLGPGHAPAVVPDIERGVAEGIRSEPWQTDTCIGSWHYDRAIFEQHRYKTVGQVVRMLVDIVSKNGNLLLSIPVKGNGEIDADEVKFLQGMAAWMDVNGEAIFATR